MDEISPLRKMIAEYIEKYDHQVTLQMLVRAIENFEEHGGLDAPGSLPRAGNWSGQYTHLWEPIRIALKLPSWRDFYASKT